MKAVQYAAVASILATCSFGAPATERTDDIPRQPWLIGVAVGQLDTEGDADVNDAYAGTLLVDWNRSDAFSLEGSITFIPELEGNTYDDYASGQRVRINRLTAKTGETETWAIGAAVDALYYFDSRDCRFRRYLSAGLGILRYGEEIGENDGLDITPRIGAGILHALTDRLVLRADFRYFLAGTVVKSESNSKLDIGLAWALGSRRSALPVPASGPRPVEAPAPSAAAREAPAATPAPAEQDYATESHELHIEFAPGGTALEAHYHEQLDVIGKLLKDTPAAKAVIEGHCDQRRGDSEEHARELTRKRAEAVRDYLAGGKWKIARSRMETIGRGFSQPKEPADLEQGNIANRRIVIGIRRPTGQAGRN